MTFKANTHSGLLYYTSQLFTASSLVKHGFSTRIGGVSRGVSASLNLGLGGGDKPENIGINRSLFCDAVGVSDDNIRLARQEHGDAIFNVMSETDFVPVEEHRDGFITALPGVPLMIFAADCLPLLLLDPKERVIAAIHCGWRGTALDIAGKAVRMMRESYGCKAENILAAMGPCIMPCHFITHDDVPEAMIDRFGPDVRPFCKEIKKGRFGVDLPGINAFALEREGVRRENISFSSLCTSCNVDEFYSHRITGFKRGVGAGIIALKS